MLFDSDIESIREERRKRKEFPIVMKEKDCISNSYTIPCKALRGGECTFHSVDAALIDLKSKEPSSDNLFFRSAIIGYEFGDLLRAIVYSERFKNDKAVFKTVDNKKVLFKDGFKDKAIILSEGKLAMADLLTQLFLLCEERWMD